MKKIILVTAYCLVLSVVMGGVVGAEPIKINFQARITPAPGEELPSKVDLNYIIMGNGQYTGQKLGIDLDSKGIFSTTIDIPFRNIEVFKKNIENEGYPQLVVSITKPGTADTLAHITQDLVVVPYAVGALHAAEADSLSDEGMNDVSDDVGWERSDDGIVSLVNEDDKVGIGMLGLEDYKLTIKGDATTRGNLDVVGKLYVRGESELLDTVVIGRETPRLQRNLIVTGRIKEGTQWLEDKYALAGQAGGSQDLLSVLEKGEIARDFDKQILLGQVLVVGRYIETNTLRIQDPKSGIVAVGNEPLRLHADMALSKAQGLKVGSLAISNKYGTANAPTNGLYVKGDAEVRGGVGVRTVASSAVGVNAEGILAGVQGKGLTSGVRGVSDSGVGVFADTAAANNAAVYAKNTGDGPAIEVSQGWIKLPSDSIAIGGAGDIVYMKAVPVGKIRNGSDNRWLTVVNSYVKDGSIILATIQDAYSFGQTTNVRAIKNGRFELYIPKQRTVAFLILNQ